MDQAAIRLQLLQLGNQDSSPLQRQMADQPCFGKTITLTHRREAWGFMD
jgi:hypothetical protein